MDTQQWNSVLARVSGHDAVDLDDIAGDLDPRHDPVGRDRFPEVEGALPPQTPMKRPDAVAIGLRVTAAPPDPADRAMRLLAFALERDVGVLVLSHVDYSGFERFGFRVERVAGETEAARRACEEQICRFWNIDLVL